MLVKSFIDNHTVKVLINWIDTQNIYLHESIGNVGFYSLLGELNNHPKIINEIRTKCQNLVKGVYQEPIIKDFVNEVFIDGFVHRHTDPTVKGYKHLRCNIMLQKPTTGGQIIFNGKAIELEVGDMYVVDTSILHSVSEVKGNNTYKTIVFGFLCNE